MTVPTSTLSARPIGWRIPAVIVLCGCLVSLVSFGPRSTLGMFLTPLTVENGWGRDVFAFAIAVQNILWGLGQPFAGAIADRFGIPRVLCAGAVLYAIGLVIMAYSTTPLMLDLGAGVFIGLGLAGCSFSIVLAAFGKLLPERTRPMAFGIGTAAGSFGQFLYSPLSVPLTNALGWQSTLITFAFLMLLVLPASIALAAPAPERTTPEREPQSIRQALSEALSQRSYVLLVLGFFTCGFQLQFITVHMPAYLVDRGLAAEIGGWTMGAIGLFNIMGSLASGWFTTLMPKRYLLAVIYLARSAAVLAFISFPVTPTTSILFGATMGLLWLSTVPPTNSIVAVLFGTRWFAMLTGFAFFSHQVGGFLGVWLGGLVFERTGSYDVLWWLAILFGVLSALINMPIIEKPVARKPVVRLAPTPV